MPQKSVNYLAGKAGDFKTVWQKINLSQRVSLAAMLFLLLTLPLGIILSLSPIKNLIGRANYPATPPSTPPNTVTPTYVISPTPTPHDQKSPINWTTGEV